MQWNSLAVLIGSLGSGVQNPPQSARLLVAEVSYVLETAMPLTRVRGIVLGRSGSIYVADELEGAIALIDPDGKFQKRIGRLGEGPGEFRRLFRIGMLNDTLWAIDRAMRRLVLFDSSGEHITTVTSGSPGASQWPEFPPSSVPEALLRGALIVSSLAPPLTHSVQLVDAEGELARELTRVDLQRQNLSVQGPRGIQTTRYQPLDDSPLWQPSPDGSRVVVLERPAASAGALGSLSVRSFRADGSRIFATSCSYTPRPVSEDEKSEMVRTAAGQHANLFGGAVRAAEEAVRRSLYLPDFFPPVAELAVGSDHRTWLRLFSDSGGPRNRWAVIDSVGRFLGIVIGPPRLSIWAANESHVWGVQQDENDIPHLIRYRIVSDDSEAGRQLQSGRFETCTPAASR